MKIYHCIDEAIVIVQFGLGLVGQSVEKTIKLFANCKEKHIPFAWGNEQLQEAALNTLFYELERIHPNKIILIWSAGKAGFSASTDMAKKELNNFKQLIGQLHRYLAAQKILDVAQFILISSAGGLYEGQVNINPDTPLNIRRPYGELKYNQELFALAIFGRNSVSIFRLSSVYSETNFKSRFGLIATLINNGVRGQVSSIYGHQDTLRDYVRDLDIGLYIVRKIFSKKMLLPQCEHLFSGRPYSIFEIKTIVQKKIHKKLFVNYLYNAGNIAPITFNTSLKPKGFRTQQLEVGIQNIIDNYSFFQ